MFFFIENLIDMIFKKDVDERYLLQDWVEDLDLTLQGKLVPVLRESDEDSGRCMECMSITKMLRYLIVNSIGNEGEYTSNNVKMRNNVIAILKRKYNNNRHWVEHIVDAAYVIGKNHSDGYVREYWISVARSVREHIKRVNKRRK